MATGGVGTGQPNSLTVDHTIWYGSATDHTQSGSLGVPTTPPLQQTDSGILTTALDLVQTGLDVAGMVPVVGEACDLTNAAISVGRGNYAEATLSMAAMIPVGGQAATAAKFANKAARAVAKNADKLDEVAASANAIKMAAVRDAGNYGEFVTGTIGPKKGVKGPLSGKMRFPDKFNAMILEESKNVKYQGWTAQLKDDDGLAQQAGVPFVLYVRPDTILSKPLQKAEASGAVKILRSIVPPQ